jgi:hypothetical protein
VPELADWVRQGSCFDADRSSLCGHSVKVNDLKGFVKGNCVLHVVNLLLCHQTLVLHFPVLPLRYLEFLHQHVVHEYDDACLLLIFDMLQIAENKKKNLLC